MKAAVWSCLSTRVHDDLDIFITLSGFERKQLKAFSFPFNHHARFQIFDSHLGLCLSSVAQFLFQITLSSCGPFLRWFNECGYTRSKNCYLIESLSESLQTGLYLPDTHAEQCSRKPFVPHQSSSTTSIRWPPKGTLWHSKVLKCYF